ncbi:MAG TPA: hypothetical protein VH208_04360 [Myxococcaceae bacterium]|nr:hypothetical protein [Myxococcaceae bacterium]
MRIRQLCLAPLLLSLGTLLPAPGWACTCVDADLSYGEARARAALEVEVTIIKPVMFGDATDGRGFHQMGIEVRVDKVTRGTWKQGTMKINTSSTCGPRLTDFAPGSRWRMLPLVWNDARRVRYRKRGLLEYDAELLGKCGTWFERLAE